MHIFINVMSVLIIQIIINQVMAGYMIATSRTCEPENHLFTDMKLHSFASNLLIIDCVNVSHMI